MRLSRNREPGPSGATGVFVLTISSYGEAKAPSENLIHCALLAKVKTPTLSNEFISSILGVCCEMAAAESFPVRGRARRKALQN